MLPDPQKPMLIVAACATCSLLKFNTTLGTHCYHIGCRPLHCIDTLSSLLFADGSFADRHRISDEDLAYSYSTYKPESPPSTCNWLLPGRLIIGSHPNVGIRSPEHKGVPSEALAPRMRKLLHLGVRTFLALQVCTTDTAFWKHLCL